MKITSNRHIKEEHMKRLLIVLLAVILLTACTTSATSVTKRKGAAEASFDIEATFDNLVNYSSNISRVKLIDTKEFDEDITEFIFEVQKDIKGKTDKVIHYYDSKYILTLDSEYILFMNRSRNIFYENDIYNGSFGSIAAVNGDVITYFEIGDGDYSKKYDTVKDLEKDIKSVDKGKNTDEYAYDDKSIDEMQIESASGLIEISDYIAELEINSIIESNQNVTFVHCKVSKAYKGEFEKTLTVMLPGEVKPGDVVLVFLSKNDSGSYQVNSSASMLTKEDKDYTKLINELEK